MPAAEGIPLAPPALRAARILVVDDVDADLRFVEDILRAAGYASVETTRHGRDVRELHRRNRYDLIVLDLVLPDIDGFEVMRQLQEDEGGYLPVLVVTAESTHLRRALECGGRDFIPKPLRVTELLLRARNMLETRVAWNEVDRRGRALEKELLERTADLRQTREVFQLFANQLPEALWIRTMEERTVLYVNQAWERLTGRTVRPGDNLETMLRSLHPDDYPAAAERLSRSPRGGVDVVLRFVRVDGGIRWVHLRTFPLLDEAGDARWVAGIAEDVTERKRFEEDLSRYARDLVNEVAVRQRTEAMLRETEQQFRALVEQSVAAIYIIDDGWRFAYVNPRLCEVLGYGAQQLIGRDVIEFVHGDDWRRLLENRERARNGEIPALTSTYRMIRKDGGVVHLAVSGRFVELGGRQVLFGLAQDITDSIVEQQRRREAEAHYTALVEQSLVGFYIRDEERLVCGNPRLREIFGFREEELSGLRLVDFVVPEDRHVLVEVLRRRQAGESGPIRFACRVRRADGRLLHVEGESKVIEIGGRRETVGVVQDVTERERAAEALRLSEEKYRLLWETSTDAVVLVGDDGVIQYANPSVAHVLGYVPEVLEGQHIGMVQPERYRRAHAEGMARFLATGERQLNWRRTEFLALHRDGREIPVEISLSRLSVGGKSLFASFMRDVSERKAAEAALAEAYDRMLALSERVLDLQEEERRALSLELHDDVGQSLVALRIGLHRLAADLPAAQARLLAECDGVAGTVQERLRELSQQLHPPQLDQLGLRDALRWLADRQRAITGLEIRCTFADLQGPRLPRALEGACFRICQEALNNATRHARARSIAIGLETQGNQLQLTVTDDGVGFDPTAARDLTHRRGSLGLIGMEQRARRAGGRLELESHPGGGTRVRAVFDLAA